MLLLIQSYHVQVLVRGEEALGADPDGNAKAGKSYVIFGTQEVIASPVELSLLDGNNGFLVTAGDAEGYHSRIMSLLSDPDEISRAGERARAYVLAHFAWPLIAEKYLRLLAAESGLIKPG